MKQHVIEARVIAAAPRDTVWAVLADARSWHTWGPWDRAELEREGHDVADGVGAIRVFTRRPITSREEVVAFEPPLRLAYRLLSGLPVREYRAEVRLTADGAATEIHWRSEFESGVPGMAAFIGRIVPRVAADMAAEAQRRAAA